MDILKCPFFQTKPQYIFIKKTRFLQGIFYLTIMVSKKKISVARQKNQTSVVFITFLLNSIRFNYCFTIFNCLVNLNFVLFVRLLFKLHDKHDIQQFVQVCSS